MHTSCPSLPFRIASTVVPVASQAAVVRGPAAQSDLDAYQQAAWGFRLRHDRWRLEQSYERHGDRPGARELLQYEVTMAGALHAGVPRDTLPALLCPAIVPDTVQERTILPPVVVAAWDGLRNEIRAHGLDRSVVLCGSAMRSRYDLCIDRPAAQPGDRYVEIERTGRAWSTWRMRMREIGENTGLPHAYVGSPSGFTRPEEAVRRLLATMSLRSQAVAA